MKRKWILAGLILIVIVGAGLFYHLGRKTPIAQKENNEAACLQVKVDADQLRSGSISSLSPVQIQRLRQLGQLASDPGLKNALSKLDYLRINSDCIALGLSHY